MSLSFRPEPHAGDQCGSLGVVFGIAGELAHGLLVDLDELAQEPNTVLIALHDRQNISTDHRLLVRHLCVIERLILRPGHHRHRGLDRDLLHVHRGHLCIFGCPLALALCCCCRFLLEPFSLALADLPGFARGFGFLLCLLALFLSDTLAFPAFGFGDTLRFQTTFFVDPALFGLCLALLFLRPPDALVLDRQRDLFGRPLGV